VPVNSIIHLFPYFAYQLRFARSLFMDSSVFISFIFIRLLLAYTAVISFLLW